MIGYILLGILFIIIVVALVIFYLLSGKAPSEVQVQGPFQLSSKTQLIGSDSFALPSASTSFLTDGKGSFQAYLYLDSLQKTGQAVECGARANQPSCSTGLYDPCKCTTEYDCTNCQHSGYKKLVSLYGVYTVEILNVPDASRPNSVSAQLVVRTKSNTDTTFESHVETIPLPPIPLQKWILLTITKDARQLNVFYNTSLVSSSKTVYLPNTMNVSGTIVEGGDSGLSGTIGLLRMNPAKFTLADISKYYDDSADTRGSPKGFLISPNAYNANIQSSQGSSFFKSLCLDLSCLSLPRVNASAPQLDIFKDQGRGPIGQASNIYDVNTMYQ